MTVRNLRRTPSAEPASTLLVVCAAVERRRGRPAAPTAGSDRCPTLGRGLAPFRGALWRCAAAGSWQPVGHGPRRTGARPVGSPLQARIAAAVSAVWLASREGGFRRPPCDRTSGRRATRTRRPARSRTATASAPSPPQRSPRRAPARRRTRSPAGTAPSPRAPPRAGAGSGSHRARGAVRAGPTRPGTSRARGRRPGPRPPSRGRRRWAPVAAPRRRRPGGPGRGARPGRAPVPGGQGGRPGPPARSSRSTTCRAARPPAAGRSPRARRAGAAPP
jgi:hypothetical protein